MKSWRKSWTKCCKASTALKEIGIFMSNYRDTKCLMKRQSCPMYRKITGPGWERMIGKTKSRMGESIYPCEDG